MQRLACLLIALLSISTASADTTPSVDPDHPILGTWAFIVPGTRCVETYHYYANGTTRATSADEVAESRYQISDMPSFNGTFKLVDTATKDNGKKDCSGNITPVGDSVTLFVYIDPANQSMLICQKENGTNCFGPLLRGQ